MEDPCQQVLQRLFCVLVSLHDHPLAHQSGLCGTVSISVLVFAWQWLLFSLSQSKLKL